MVLGEASASEDWRNRFLAVRVLVDVCGLLFRVQRRCKQSNLTLHASREARLLAKLRLEAPSTRGQRLLPRVLMARQGEVSLGQAALLQLDSLFASSQAMP